MKSKELGNVCVVLRVQTLGSGNSNAKAALAMLIATISPRIE